MSQPVAQAQEAGARCQCGFAWDHHMVSPDPVYDKKGWFWNLFGVSWAPISLKFTCRVCGTVILETRDPALIKRHV